MYKSRLLFLFDHRVDRVLASLTNPPLRNDSLPSGVLGGNGLLLFNVQRRSHHSRNGGPHQHTRIRLAEEKTSQERHCGCGEHFYLQSKHSKPSTILWKMNFHCPQVAVMNEARLGQDCERQCLYSLVLKSSRRYSLELDYQKFDFFFQPCLDQPTTSRIGK